VGYFNAGQQIGDRNGAGVHEKGIFVQNTISMGETVDKRM
jgi:hypothetical protein